MRKSTLVWLFLFFPIGIFMLITDLKNKSKNAIPSKESPLSDEIEFVGDEYGLDLTAISAEEKLAILIGLLCLYGDGEFSEKEISALQKVIKDSNISFKSISYRDPEDKDLCVYESVAWVLEIVKNEIKFPSDHSEEDVRDVFELITKSLDQDIHNKNSTKDQNPLEFKKNLKENLSMEKNKRDEAKAILEILTAFAGADGTISDKEKELISIYKSKSKFA